MPETIEPSAPCDCGRCMAWTEGRCETTGRPIPVSLYGACEHCGQAKARRRVNCPDGREGCGVAHYRIGCPARCEETP